MDKTQEAARPAPMVVVAARALCKRASEICDVNDDDNWKVYGEEFLADAEVMLKAIGAPDLLQALRDLMALESRGRIMPIGKEWDAARAAIAKATGSEA